MYTIHINVKVKITQRHAGAGTEGLYVFSTSTLDDDGWSAPRPGHLTQGKETRYPLYKRLGGPRSIGRVWKIFPAKAFEFQTVQPVASRYTDCTIAAAPMQVVLC